eukprot:5799143-Prymnesium_polylepis.2
MTAYVQQLASKYLPRPLDTYPKYAVPSTKALFKAYETALKREHTPPAALCSSYASKVGAMIFAAPAARFECAYSIGICARCLTFPTPEMDECADRIICYMAQHADDGITFDGTAPGASVFKAFSDSDWCTAHSTSGWCALYGNAAVAYASKRQHSVALSSTEAEIMAASLAAAEIIFLRGLLREMGVDVTEPTTLFVDNQGAEALAKDRRSCQRSRHIERRYLKVREWVHHGEIKVVYVTTEHNPADLLTKSLERGPFERHVGTLSGGSAAAASLAQLMNATWAATAKSGDPLSVWEAYFASSAERTPDPTEFAQPDATEWHTAAAFIAESPSANLLRVLAAAAPDAFSSQLFTTPFGTTEPTLLSAEPADFANDYPSLRQAAASDDRD